MSKTNGKNRLKNDGVSMDDAFIAEGFHRLDPTLIERRPPKIVWGLVYRGVKEDVKGRLWDDARRIEYLERLCATMNHAARLIQDERNQLLELCVQKEEQINALKKAIEQNNEMIQAEISRHNAEKQEMLAAIATMKAERRGEDFETRHVDDAARLGFTLRKSYTGYRTWEKDSRVVYEHKQGGFTVKVDKTWVDGTFDSFEEAACAV